MSSLQKDLPKIRIKWIRMRDRLTFNRPSTYLELGLRGTGKSSLLETIASRYLERGAKLLDLFGSRDSEGLAWLRSPFSDLRILLVTGDNVTIKNTGHYDVVQISNLSINDIENHDITLSVSAFYSTLNDEFHALGELIKLIWARRAWNIPWFVMVREASNFCYSRIKVVKNQTEAKADFIYTLREGRHNGVAVGADSLRWTAIDKEVRDISDFFIIKQVGSMGLPKDLSFIYRYVNPITMMRLKPDQFVILTKKGAIGKGVFTYPFWHKEEKEDIVKLLGLEIEYSEPISYGVANRNTVSDFEHADIVTKTLSMGSMRAVGRVLQRSHQTITSHIHSHDNDVYSTGKCRVCSRVKSPNSRIIVLKTATLKV